MNKKVLNSQDSRNTGKAAISILATSVKKTLGPGGNPIIIQRTGQNPDGSPIGPLITKDGVTVAEHTTLRDPALNTFAQAIMQVAQKTVQDGGDGTTTSVVLAEAIYKTGLKYVEQGSNGIELYNALNSVKDNIVAILDSEKIPVQGDDVLNVARISSNGDEEIAQIVFDAIKAAGEDGYVSLEDGFARETTLDVVEGAVYKSGYRKFSSNGTLMINDKSRNICELPNPAVLLYAGKLDKVQDFQDFLAKVWGYNEQSNTYDDVIPLMIVANDFSDDIKNRILQIRVQGNLPIGAVKSPVDGSPNARTEMLQDLACMLGATVAARGILELADVDDTHLGNAERVEIGSEEVVFFGGKGDKKEILARLEDLNQLLESGQLHEYDADNVRLRKGKMSGGIAIVKVGGVSELEMAEKKDRIEDALCAAKVAIKDGILPGGGYSLYAISNLIKGEDIATKIMREALQAPIRQIIENAGKKPDIILTKMPEEVGYGYDARKHEYVELVTSGIVDPAIVTKSAVENAVSIAGLLLTTGGALVADQISKDGQPNPLAGMFG